MKYLKVKILLVLIAASFLGIGFFVISSVERNRDLLRKTAKQKELASNFEQYRQTRLDEEALYKSRYKTDMDFKKSEYDQLIKNQAAEIAKHTKIVESTEVVSLGFIDGASSGSNSRSSGSSSNSSSSGSSGSNNSSGSSSNSSSGGSSNSGGSSGGSTSQPTPAPTPKPTATPKPTPRPTTAS